MKPLDTLSAISVAIIWGMGFVIAKAAMEHFSPILLMALRFTLTALCMIWFFRPDPKLFNKLFWIAFVSAAIQYSLTFTGVSGIDASTAALLIQLEVPFAILLAAVVLGDKLTIRQGVGVSLAFCGAILIVGEPKLANNMRYVLMVIGGGFAWSLGQIMIKMMGVSGGFSLISSVAVFAAPQLFIASYLLEDNQIDQIITASPAAWAAVVYLGLVMTDFRLCHVVPTIRLVRCQHGHAILAAFASGFSRRWLSIFRRDFNYQNSHRWPPSFSRRRHNYAAY